MTPESLTAHLTVPLFGALICVAPAATRPTLQFGVRVPGDRVRAAVIRRERRAYYRRSAVVGVCCTAAAMTLPGSAPWWLAEVVLLLQVAAGLGCFWLAREKIIAVKNAEGWFEGLRQTVAADTSWRTDPIRFPVLWLIPAITVIAATAVIGAIRYPDLPGRLAVHFTASGAPSRWAHKSAWIALSVVVGQLWVTVLWTGLLLIIYRSRPDIDASDAAASTRRYRTFLATYARALLTLVALVNISLLLKALEVWQVYRLSGVGSLLPALPAMAGVLTLVAIALRMGQGGFRLPGTAHDQGLAAGVDRDDDRFWKGGLIYVNRDDPALMVGNRFSVGFTFNFGNPAAWLICGTIAAVPGGLAVIRAAAGM
jgi:uncharacterized membrane protein